MKKLVLIKDLFKEDYPWLPVDDIQEGTILYEEIDHYGCLSKDDSGVAVRLSDNPNTKIYNPYFEVPKDAVKDYHGPSFSIN